MKTFRGLTTNTILITALFFGMGQLYFSPTIIRSNRNDHYEGAKAPMVQEPCNRTFTEQEIPDDGSWLKICWADPSVPEQSVVTKVHVKYLVDHPNLSQLEVQLMRDESSTMQTLVGGDLVQDGSNFGKTVTLESFNETPAEGNWYFLIRNIVPGSAGKLQSLTILPIYTSAGNVSAKTSGDPGEEPASYRIPADAVESTTPDSDPLKNQGKLQKNLQNIKTETFEGIFPSTGWELLDGNPNDGKEYLWNDRSYRPHNGSWAGWPAGGGANGITPNSSTSYPPNMNSWMIYGPFDLSNAVSAETVFWLWRKMEPTYDYLFFGISHDRNGTFTGFNYYGTAAWEEKHVDMSNYLGDSSVWVAWSFVSDGSIQYEGPWVDDILINEDIPGTITVNGTFSYTDRGNVTQLGRIIKVELYDDDPNGTDDLLATVYTDINGNFTFPTRINWDNDTDADPGNRKLDLYVVFVAENFYYRVTDTDTHVYSWASATSTNAPDGSLNLSSTIPAGFTNLGAMWIFQDLQHTWETVSPYTNPGYVTAKWEQNIYCLSAICSSFFWGGIGGPYVFISHNNLVSSDTVIHETGHHYMYNATGFWTWWDTSCYEHFLFGQEDTRCAWSEGWADFLPLAVNNDPCYDFGIGPCTGYDNLETHSRNDNPSNFAWGDTVEGRVAGALYDLYDNTSEGGYDSANFGLSPIINIVLQGAGEETFSDFWNSWQTNGLSKHHTVRAFYQNTIDYNTAPSISNLPDWQVPHNSTWSNAFNLLNYSSDQESTISELSQWQIIFTSDPRCGVSIDSSRNIDIAPQANWQGFCNITVQVSDSIATGTGQFRVYVTQDTFADVPSSYWAYSWIERVYAAGISGGCASDPNRYCPEASVNRAQMAIFLLRGIHGSSYYPPTASGTMFTDVPSSYWAASWIEQLAQEGITSGCGNGYFCPESAVTRAQMAIFLLRSKYGASYSPPPANGTMFIDVPSSYWAAPWIEQLVHEGISSGCSNGYFCPESTVTRAQMAVFLVRTFNLP